jgi:hypothetical protein
MGGGSHTADAGAIVGGYDLLSSSSSSVPLRPDVDRCCDVAA